MWFFWSSHEMSFLRYMTLLSASKIHPNVHLVLRDPIPQSARQWAGGVRQDFQLPPPIANWMPAALNLPITTHRIEDLAPAVAALNAPDPHANDLLMYWILANIGGTCADMDIVFLAPVPDIETEVQVPRHVLECRVDHRTARQKREGVRLKRTNVLIPLGFLQGSPCAEWRAAYHTAMKRYDPDDYQSGVFCLNQDRPGFLPPGIVYPWPTLPASRIIRRCFVDETWPPFASGCIGVHWYGGGAQEWNAATQCPEDLGAGAVPWAIRKVLAS